MRKLTIKMLSVAAIAAFLMTMAGIATAAATITTKDVGKLNAEITMLNYDAKLPQGDQVVAKQLADNFNVGSDKIQSLRTKNMQYGDMAAILAFADKMPGGITDANINQVANMKKSNAGWDQVAKNTNADVSDVASTLSSIEDDAHNGIKVALADSFAGGKAAGGVQPGQGMSEGMPGGATGGTGTTEGMPGGATGGTGTEGMPGGNGGSGGGGY